MGALAVCFCALSVAVWMMFSSAAIPSSPAGFFSHSSKTRQGKGWLLQSGGVVLKCLSIFKWPLEDITEKKSMQDVLFKFVPIAEGEI